MKSLVPALFLALLALSSPSRASGPLDELVPNNTDTRLASLEESDPHRVVELVSAHYWRHYYGSELILELSVADLDWRKEIHVVNRPHRRSFQPAWNEDELAFTSGGAQAIVLGVEGGRTRIAVKVPAGYSGYGDSNLHDVYVKMGGSQYSVTGIRLEKGD